MTHLLFVYGTLKKGFHNHTLISNATYRGRATLGDEYILYSGYLPYVKHTPPGVISPGVVGELYEVPEELIADLDSLEGHPLLYTRTQVPVKYGTITLQAEVYLYAREVDSKTKVVREYNPFGLP